MPEASFKASEVIPQMADAALKAAHIALFRRRQGLQSGQKPDGSEITNGDYQSQQIIEAELRKIMAQHAELADAKFLMEEQMGTAEQDFTGRKSGYHWVVDPIDGTIGYSGKEHAPWTISIALEKDGETIAAVVYEADRREYSPDHASITPNAPKGAVYWAASDEPAAHRVAGNITLDSSGVDYTQMPIDPNNPESFMKLKQVPDLKINWEHKYDEKIDPGTKIMPGAKARIDRMKYDLVSDSPQNRYNKQFTAACGFDSTNSARNTTGVGAALGVAQGTVRAMTSTGGYPWDHAAVKLILQKSGAEVVEYDTGDEKKGRRTMIASRDPALFQTMQKAIRELTNLSGVPLVRDIGTPQQSGIAPAALENRAGMRLGL